MKLLRAGAMGNICVFSVWSFLAKTPAIVNIWREGVCLFVWLCVCLFFLCFFLVFFVFWFRFWELLRLINPRSNWCVFLVVMTFKNLFKASRIGKIVPRISRFTQDWEVFFPHLESQILQTTSSTLECNF